jgi:hypothetical protein
MAMENHHFKQVIQLQVSHVQICSITILDYRRVLISGAAHPKNHVFFGAHREWATLPRTNRMINESGYFAKHDHTYQNIKTEIATLESIVSS